METPSQWDKRLRDHIDRLRKKILTDEAAGIAFMRSEGASEEIISQVASGLASRGSRIDMDPSMMQYDRTIKLAEQIAEFSKAYPFRTHTYEPQIVGPGLLPLRIVTNDGTFCLNTSHLSREVKQLLVKQVALLIPYNCLMSGWTGRLLLEPYVYYPSQDLMNAVQWLLTTHSSQELLEKTPKIDEEARALLVEFLDSDEYKEASQRILQSKGM